MKNIGLSLDIRNPGNKSRKVMNGNLGSGDFQVGLNDSGDVVVVIDGQEFTKETLGSGGAGGAS